MAQHNQKDSRVENEFEGYRERETERKGKNRKYYLDESRMKIQLNMGSYIIALYIRSIVSKVSKENYTHSVRSNQSELSRCDDSDSN